MDGKPKPSSSAPIKEGGSTLQKLGKLYVTGLPNKQKFQQIGTIGVTLTLTTGVLALYVLSGLFGFPDNLKQGLELQEARDTNSELERLDREMKSYFNAQYYSMY